MFDLKKFRENSLNITQSEFAKRTGLRQDHVSRLEKNPSSITYEELLKIALSFGLTIDQLVNFKKPVSKKIVVDDFWSENEEYKRLLLEYVGRKIDKIKYDLKTKKDLEKLVIKLNELFRKPKIAFVGRSDTGKSAMISHLLSNNILPTAWTPTTSIAVYIKHVNSRPKFITEEAWIIKDIKGETFDDSKIGDQEYMNKWKLAVGNYELLKKYGVRTIGVTEKSSAAVLFVENDLLLNCDLIDLPGFGTGDRIEDDTYTLNAKKKADIIVYLSIANGFLREEDFDYLKETISNLKTIENKENKLLPLNNLFIVASQAHTIDQGDIVQIKKILSEGNNRFSSAFPQGFFDFKEKASNLKYNQESLFDRLYYFSTDSEVLFSRFVNDLVEVTKTLPKIMIENAKAYVKSFVSIETKNIISYLNSYERIIKDKRKYNDFLINIKNKEPSRLKQNEAALANVNLLIDQFNDKSFADFKSEYIKVINEEYISNKIKSLKLKNNKNDIKTLISYINSDLQIGLNRILTYYSEQVSKSVDKYLSGYNSSINIEKNDDIVLPIFDKQQLFASGFSGIATFGALAFWASSVGNLGGYLIAAQGIGIISALGIPLGAGGSAAVMSLIAAIGGPITLGIAFSFLAFTSSLFFGNQVNWEKNISKRIVKEYESKFVLNQYNKMISDFWIQTRTAFMVAVEGLEEKWYEYKIRIDLMVNNNKDVEEKVDELKELLKFFDEIKH
jgi:transcriptional regulator with XRE-family HTH domain